VVIESRQRSETTRECGAQALGLGQGIGAFHGGAVVIPELADVINLHMPVGVSGQDRSSTICDCTQRRTRGTACASDGALFIGRIRRYLTGFGNEHATEAYPGTLPEGPERAAKKPRGLYSAQISGTPFTAPRGHNRPS
jgi:hypothetical protein